MSEKQSFPRSLRFGLLLSLAFALLHLFRLTHHGLWIDELHTFGTIRLPWREMAAERFSAGHIPTYFLLIKAWCHLAWTSEWSLRLPSVAFATLAFFAFFLLARRFITERGAFLTALALFFFHPFLLWASQDARMYALLCFTVVFAAHQLLSFVETEEKKYLAGYAAAISIGLSLHILFVLQVVAHAAFLAARHRRLLARYALAAAPPFAVLLPVILVTIFKTREYKPGIEWKFPDLFLVVRKMSVVSSTDLGEYLPWQGGVFEAVCRNVSTAFFLIFLGLVGWRYRSARHGQSAPERAAPRGQDLLIPFAFYSMGVPAVLMAVSLFFNNEKVGASRYYIPALGAFVAIAAIELGDLRVSGWRRVLKWTYAAFFLFALVSQLSWRGPGIRESILYVRDNANPGDGVVYCHAGALRYAFAFYDYGRLDSLPVDRDEMDTSILLDRILNFSKGRKKIYLVLHNPKKSPLPTLLDDRPDLFERFEDRETGVTRVKVYRVTPVKTD